MLVAPKVRGFICTTAHPEGCRENVKRQIDYIKSQGVMDGPKNILIIGASTGYGLASRITAAFGLRAATIGIMYEKQAQGTRTATPGWYKTRAFEEFAAEEGLYAKSINGDAFSIQVKEEAVELIRKDLGKIDMVIYSLAAPRRTMADGTVYQSVLKTTDQDFTNKSLDLRNNTIKEATITPAEPGEIEATIKVMGGEDWYDWIRTLSDQGVLSENAVTAAYSYIGPKLTYPVYYNGTIGMAKKHLSHTAEHLNRDFSAIGLKAYISVNKALVTQASSAIPVVPLYFAILYRVMKEKGLHEGCIEQIRRLFYDKKLCSDPVLDSRNQIRLDDYEMQKDVQEEVMAAWDLVTTENVACLADLDGYWDDFYHMFGFRFESVDYDKDIDI